MRDHSFVYLFNILLFKHHKEKILCLEQVYRLMTKRLICEWRFAIIVIDEKYPLSEEVADAFHLIFIVVGDLLAFYLSHCVHQLRQLPCPDQCLLSWDNPIHWSLGRYAFLHEIEQSLSVELWGYFLQLGLAGIQESQGTPVIAAHLQVLHQKDGCQDG